MNEEKLKLVSRVFVIAIALTMVLPVSAIISGHSDTATIVPEMASTSTSIRLAHAGIQFDDTIGEPAISNDLMARNGDKYILQFKGPIMPGWVQELRDNGVKVYQHVDDYAYVVGMDYATKEVVESLPTVGWVGTYQPAYKIDTQLQGKTGQVTLAVFAFDNPVAMAQALESYGTVTSIEAGLDKVYVTADAASLPAIAQISDVKEIFYQADYQTLNNRAGEVEGNHILWDTSLSELPQIITGQGIRVGIADTGWDTGNTATGHWDMTRGPLGSRVAVAEADDGGGDPTTGHGTHCAGIILGNGYCMEQFLGLDNTDRVYYDTAAAGSNPYGNDLQGFAGVAPEATLEAHNPLGTSDWNTMQANGCAVISNSWGPTGVPSADYDADCTSADNLMSGDSNLMVVFAAGNSGPAPRTISGGGQSWMGLSVAASENFRPEGMSSSDDPNQLIEFSSRGPMTSGRIKPDISAIGTEVYSTKWSGETADEYSDIYRDNLVDEYGPDGVADYRAMSGTSMACPHITGHVALINQYLQDIEGIPNPDRVLIKAILLNGAIDMGYGYPNFQTGWGRVNIKNSLVPDAPRTNQWAEGSLATGNTWDFAVDGGANTYIESDRVPLKVMLCWDMPTGAAMSDDYELEVTSPSGDVFKGNCFDQSGLNEDWSHPNPTAATWDSFGSPTVAPYGFDFDTDGDNDDDINNVEAVFIEKPEVGQWTVVVRSDSTPDAPTFAVAWGADTGPIETYKVEMSTDYPTTFSTAQGGSATLPFNILNFGTSADSVLFSDDADADLTVTYSEASPLSLASNADKDIMMQVSASGTAAVGVHTFTLTAVSVNDPGTPKTQDKIEIEVEVLAQALPTKFQVSTNEMNQYGPSVVAFTDQGGTDHVIIAYASEEQELNGYRVYAKHTTDDLTSGGAVTWAKAAASTSTDGPGDIRITHMPSGTYQDRVFISWSGWNPTDFSDYGGSWSYVSWADPPYTTWNPVQVFSNADNGAYDDIYRMTMTACRGSTDEVMMIVESNEYSGGALSAVDTFGKISTNGGVTWGALQQVSPGDGNYYFFPNAYTDQNDNIICNYYWRTPTGTDRDLCYNYYNGAWQPAGAYYPILDTTDNCMFPSGTSTLEGPGGTNRLYNFFTRGTTSNSPKDGYVLWADTSGGYPTVAADWNGPYEVHPDIAGSTISDSNYGDRPVLDVDATFEAGIWYVWPQYLEDQADYNPYGVPNVHNTVSNDGFATMKELNRITADAYSKNHQVGDSLGAYMYEAYSSYSGNLETGNMDIWLRVYHYGWESDADIWGPGVSSVGTTPNPVGQGWSITVQANVDDTSYGFSNIAAAEWSEGASPAAAGTGSAMTALDGTFSSPTEAVTGTADTTGWALGYHTIWVRGRDAAGNWGEAVAGTVEVKDINAAPTVTVTAPNAADTILSGTTTITWTASDVEDASDTLMTYVNYSADGGAIWNPITSGYLTNAAGSGSTSWATGADGVNYLIRVEAVDSGGKTGGDNSDTPFSVDNTADDQWFFQVQATGLNKDLDMKPVELTPNVASSAALSAAGQYQIGTWETPGTYTGSIAGAWDFNIYGRVDNPGTLDAYLYAIVKDGTGATLDTTVNDNENVGGFPASHLFTWTDTLAGTITGTASVRVEIWLNVVTPSGGGGTNTYHPSDAGFTASFWDVDAMPPTGLNLNLEYPFTATQDTDTSVSNNVRAASLDPGNFDEIFTWCDVTVAEDPASITSIDLTFEGQGNAATSFNLWALTNSGGWAATGDTIALGAGTDGTLTGTISSNFADYIIGGVLTWGVYQTDSSDLIRVDLLETVVNYNVPAPVFNMEYDYGTTQSNVVPTVGGAPPPTYDIPVTGFAAGDWTFVSFGWDVSGAIETVLDDSINGDGLTTWDTAKWYDITDPADHWKSYNPSKPAALNDLATIDGTMGVWIHLTGNAGDQVLTLGVSGGYSGAAVNVPLYTGWNLVGYPSATARQADLTLPAQADMMAVYDGAQPYLVRDVSDLTTVIMTEGNAYWVHATADTTWIVNP